MKNFLLLVFLPIFVTVLSSAVANTNRNFTDRILIFIETSWCQHAGTDNDIFFITGGDYSAMRTEVKLDKAGNSYETGAQHSFEVGESGVPKIPLEGPFYIESRPWLFCLIGCQWRPKSITILDLSDKKRLLAHYQVPHDCERGWVRNWQRLEIPVAASFDLEALNISISYPDPVTTPDKTALNEDNADVKVKIANAGNQKSAHKEEPGAGRRNEAKKSEKRMRNDWMKEREILEPEREQIVPDEKVLDNKSKFKRVDEADVKVETANVGKKKNAYRYGEEPGMKKSEKGTGKNEEKKSEKRMRNNWMNDEETLEPEREPAVQKMREEEKLNEEEFTASKDQ